MTGGMGIHKEGFPGIQGSTSGHNPFHPCNQCKDIWYPKQDFNSELPHYDKVFRKERKMWVWHGHFHKKSGHQGSHMVRRMPKRR